MAFLTKIACSWSTFLATFYFDSVLKLFIVFMYLPREKTATLFCLSLFICMVAGRFPSLCNLVKPHAFSHRYDAGNTSLYPVQDFVKSSNYGLIAVSIQYRLGLFGKQSTVNSHTCILIFAFREVSCLEQN